MVSLLTSTGCSDSFLAGPIVYEEQETMTKEVPGKSNLAGKPGLQQKVREALANLFGKDPQNIVVQPGAPLTGGDVGYVGIRLANHIVGADGKVGNNGVRRPDGAVATRTGGYGVYRRHCLHCHGVSGAGDGPTAPFLYPIPRDYRRGLFKFTSTPNGARPVRDVGWGFALAAAIGIPGLAFYLLGRAMGITVEVQASALNAAWWTVPVLVLSALQNGLLEEVVAVGYLSEKLGQLKWRGPVIVVASALLRGSYHLYQGWGPFIGNAIMGVVFAEYYRRTRRVAPLVVAHFLMDMVVFVGYDLVPHAWLVALGLN